MEEAISLVVLGTLAGKLVDFFKYVHAKDWNAVTTQAAVWVAGVIVIVLGANADAFQALVIPGMESELGSLNTWSLLLIGLSLTSLISVVYDFKKAVDGSDSAAVPKLTSLPTGPRL